MEKIRNSTLATAAIVAMALSTSTSVAFAGDPIIAYDNFGPNNAFSPTHAWSIRGPENPSPIRHAMGFVSQQTGPLTDVFLPLLWSNGANQFTMRLLGATIDGKPDENNELGSWLITDQAMPTPLPVQVIHVEVDDGPTLEEGVFYYLKVSAAGDTTGAWRQNTMGDIERAYSLNFQPWIVTQHTKGAFRVVLGVECPADLTGSGQVGVPDLLALLSAWGPCNDPGDCPGDLTGSGEVGVPDLLVLLASWGSCPTPAPLTGACCLPDGSCTDDVVRSECMGSGGYYKGHFSLCGFQNCPELQADYQFDSNQTNNSVGLPTAGVIMWLQRYEVFGSQDEITSVATAFGHSAYPAGVQPGHPFGVALYVDNGTTLGDLIWFTTSQINAEAIQTDNPQIVPVPNIPVEGSFFVAAWVHDPGFENYPAPYDSTIADQSVNVWVAGDSGATFETFDPINHGAWSIQPKPLQLAGAVPPGVWMIRANGTE